jgi:RimJ/RimL family protein N-acetyltransferase
VRVRLRPLRGDDLDWLVEMSADPVAVGEHNWAGPVDRDELRRRLADETDRSDTVRLGYGRLIIELLDGTPIGDVAWRTERWGPSPESACPAIGIALLPEHRGVGYGTEAQRLLVELLIRLGAHRVQSDTADDNPGEQRALERVGFLREGVVRDAEFRNGTYHDHVLYGIVRRDWSLDDSLVAHLPLVS